MADSDRTFVLPPTPGQAPAQVAGSSHAPSPPATRGERRLQPARVRQIVLAIWMAGACFMLVLFLLRIRGLRGPDNNVGERWLEGCWLLVFLATIPLLLVTPILSRLGLIEKVAPTMERGRFAAVVGLSIGSLVLVLVSYAVSLGYYNSQALLLGLAPLVLIPQILLGIRLTPAMPRRSGGGPVADSRKVRILFVAANPVATSILRLDQEQREITEKIRAAEFRDSIEFIPIVATRRDALMQALLQYKPHILHFSGHGTTAGEIILLDEQDLPKPLAKEAFVGILSALKKNIRLVVLNACYTRPQAEAIAEFIDCVLGTDNAINDDAALVFAANFYRAIGFGESVQTAFDVGRAALLGEHPGEADRQAIYVRQGINAASIFVLDAADSAEDD